MYSTARTLGFVLASALIGAALSRVSAGWTAVAVGMLAGAMSFALWARKVSAEARRIGVLLSAWGVYYLSGVTLRGRGTQDIAASALDGAALWRVVLVAVVALVVVLGFFGFSERREGLGRGGTGNGALMALGAFVVLSVLSTAWSVFPSWTAYKSLEYAVGLILAVVLARSVQSFSDLASVVNTTWLLLGFMLASVWIGFALSPGSALVESRGVLPWQLRGVLPVLASNGVGDLAGTLLLVASSRLGHQGHHRRWWGLLAAIAATTMLLAQARSAVLGLVAGLIVLLVVVPGLRKRGWMLGLVGGGAAYFFADAAMEYLRRGQSDAQLVSLSGRTQYWTAATALTSESPLVGNGAFAAGRFGVLQELGATATSSLHNTWMEVLVGLGWSGLLLLIVGVSMIAFSLLRLAHKFGGSDGGWILAEVSAVLSFEIVRSAFTSGAIIWHPANRFLLAVVVYLAWTGVAGGWSVLATDVPVPDRGSPG